MACNNCINDTRPKTYLNNPSNLLDDPQLSNCTNNIEKFFFAKDQNTLFKVTVNHCKYTASTRLLLWPVPDRWFVSWTTNTVANSVSVMTQKYLRDQCFWNVKLRHWASRSQRHRVTSQKNRFRSNTNARTLRLSVKIPVVILLELVKTDFNQAVFL